MRRDIVFVHIPKTAGTSVRSLLETVAREHIVLRDYAEAPETTPALRKLVHVEKKTAEFRKAFNKPGKGILLSGHFPAARYWDYFNAESFVTFLRHPVDRVISEYVHFVNIKGWKGSLEQFARRPGARNTLSQFLKDVDLESFGFIGFVEDFEAAVPVLGAWLGAELLAQKMNVGDYARAGVAARAADKDRALLADLNAEDIALYGRLRASRGGHPRATGAGPDIANSYVGAVRLHHASTVTGCLFNRQREFIAEVEISAAGQTLAVVAADRYREGTKERGSRSGVCAFRFNLNEIFPAGRAAAAHTVCLRARGSDFELNGSPIQLG